MSKENVINLNPGPGSASETENKGIIIEKDIEKDIENVLGIFGDAVKFLNSLTMDNVGTYEEFVIPEDTNNTNIAKEGRRF